MRCRHSLLAGLVLLLAAGASQAGWGFGFSVGVPYYRPYYRPYYYYPRAAVVVAPTYPVYVAPQAVDLSQLVDNSFAEYAAQQLGPY